MGPGWGWAAFLLPYLEQGNLYGQINFNQPVGTGVNAPGLAAAAGDLPVPVGPVPAGLPRLRQQLHHPIATVAHGNYVGCNGWEECFNGAGGNPAGPGPTAWPALRAGGRGVFYRNSRTRIADVTDGMSNTIFVGERSGNHSPSTWTGAVPGGRCPAWMATQPPRRTRRRPGPAYDNADFGEALVLAHCNATHLPSADFPIFDPDTFYSLHTGRGELPVRRRLGAFPHQRHQPVTYQVPGHHRRRRSPRRLLTANDRRGG